MKQLTILLFSIIMTGCETRPDTAIINTAARHFSGVFITQSVKSVSGLRVKVSQVVTSDTNNIYTVTGLVEGYSSMNYPVSVDHFSETLQYLGGNPNIPGNWKCIGIQIGNKKVK